MFIDTNIKGLTIEEVEQKLKQQRPDLEYEYMKEGIRIDMRSPKVQEEQKRSRILLVSIGTSRVKVFTYGGDIHLKMYPKSAGFFSLFSKQKSGNTVDLENELALLLSDLYKGEIVRVGQIRNL